MQEDDLNILQRITAKNKVRYDELDVNIKDKIVGTNCYVLIDFMSLFTNVQSFKEGLVDDKDFDMHVAIECLNIYAHYKHYFQTRDANHVILIGFVKDKYFYEKNKNIMDMLYEFSKFFPNIYTIPNIINKGLNTHIVENVIINMRGAFNSSQAKQSAIFLMSSNSSDRQLLFAFPTKTAYTIFKGYGFGPTTFMSKEDILLKIMKKQEYLDNFNHKAELEYLNVLLGKFFNTVKFKNPKFDKATINYKHTRIQDKINVLNDFVEKTYNPSLTDNMCLQFMKYLLSIGEIDDDGFSKLSEYEQFYDYRFQNSSRINEITVPLFKQWKQKIKDYSISRESENYKLLVSHMMYTNWLLT